MFRLTFFILVALALHALAYLELTPRLTAKEPRTVRTTVVPVRLSAKREAKRTAPPAAPAVKSAPKPRPKVAVPPKPEAKSAPDKAIPNKEAPLPKLTRHADQAGPDHGRRKPKAEKRAEKKAAPKPPTPTPTPKKAAPKRAAPKKVVAGKAGIKKTSPPAPAGPTPKPAAAAGTTFKSRQDYFQRVARLAERAPRAGWAVPDLVTDDGLTFAEMRDILRFYGCKVVAYPLPRGGAPSFFLELGGDGLDKAVRREGKNMLDGYSSRARDLTDQPGFWKLLARVASAHQLDPYHACIAAVVPERVDRYFLYMQDRAARRAGLPLDALRSTRGRFRRTNVGWTLEIYEVTPRQGRPVAVKIVEG